MRVLILIYILFASSNLLSQDLENKVCACIANNFTQIDFNYFHVLDKIEEDLVSNDIIQKSSTSRIDQIKSVSEKGIIEKSRSYENIIFEQLGLRTVKYCINLHTYSDTSNQPSQYFKLMRDMDILHQNIQKPIDLKSIRRVTATTILKYQGANENSKLWKLLQLEYLYLLAETKEMKKIPTLIEFDLIDQDTTNTINIDVNSNDQITIDNRQISKDKICTSIQGSIEKGKGIHLTNEKDTKYKLYLEVYNLIKDCILELRNEKSIDMFKAKFEKIDDKQKIEIMKIVPMRIVETSP